MLKNWKTSLCGLAVLVLSSIASSGQVDPATAAICLKLSTWIASFGLIVAADHNVTIGISPGPSKPAGVGITNALFLALLLGLLAFLFTGCSVLRVSNEKPTGEKTRVTCYVPAWPWQDSSRAVEKLNVYSRTNSFSSTLTGLNEAEITSTNATALFSEVVSAAVGAAVKAAVPIPK